jgi:hypothetical protein
MRARERAAINGGIDMRIGRSSLEKLCGALAEREWLFPFLIV